METFTRCEDADEIARVLNLISHVAVEFVAPLFSTISKDAAMNSEFVLGKLIQKATLDSWEIVISGALLATWISVRVLGWIASFQMAAPFQLCLYVDSIYS